MSPETATCECGYVSFEISGSPLFRLFCHCTICQEFNDAPFADIVVYKPSQISELQEERVKFNRLKPPPNVQRGKCTKCDKPIIEQFAALVFPSLTIVPASVHQDTSSLPDSAVHIFYDKRLSDSDDSLPKHSGFISSQFAFCKFLLTSK